MQSKPTHTTTFEAKIRSEWLLVTGEAWGDESGIYRTKIASAYLDDVNVIGLLTAGDLGELEEQILNAIANETIGE
jgi:hypothetical protein